MILSKKVQIELNKRQYFIISTLLGIIDNETESSGIKIQSVFYKNEIERVGNDTLKLILKNPVKEWLRSEKEIYDNFLFLTNPVIAQIERIVKVKLLSFINNSINLLILYEVEEKKTREFNKRLLSIYIGEYEPVTAFDSGSEDYFVDGTEYLERLFYYVGEIDRLFNVRRKQLGCEKPEPTKRIERLIEKSSNVLKDLIHKLSRKITDYCIKNNVTTVIVGKAQEVKLFPVKQFINQLKYKLRLEGIPLIIVNGSQEYLNFEELPGEIEKLKEKVKQDSFLGLFSRKNRQNAFKMLSDYLDEIQLELIPGLTG